MWCVYIVRVFSLTPGQGGVTGHISKKYASNQ